MEIAGDRRPARGLSRGSSRPSLGLLCRAMPSVRLTVSLTDRDAGDDTLDIEVYSLSSSTDVFVHRREVCGVLVELLPDRPGMVNVGIESAVPLSF